jgi:hypothetical protein
MKLDYGSLLSPEPIQLSIGTLRNPTLREISKVTFSKFGIYQFFLKLTPEDYFTKVNVLKANYWNNLSDEQKETFSLYDIVTVDEVLCNTYVEIFNFFFVERVVFREGFFVLLNTGDYSTADSDIEVTKDIIRSVIHKDIFNEVLDLLQQICFIKTDEEIDESTLKFKNEKARKLWRKMQEAAKEQKKNSEHNADMTLPNIISSVAAKSYNLNIMNIWDITLFQLYDQFNRLQNNDAHSINSMRVAAWGDEKRTFDYALWHKNMFEKNKQ